MSIVRERSVMEGTVPEREAFGTHVAQSPDRATCVEDEFMAR